ncbi:LysR family transcriptional regulator [Hydrogenophaga sp. BPS33]|uniref:LysR family transcriptional regulator n=1 Tax=Hydrogenophaga sp. BPS33 TaxID=2651974 RepID=UPI0013204ED5|nr:LysR substrate-binding domain-containing protein [Hydrogenophaga sp. BPS33]QHE88051.1 LysR family transcriptional regulator [Hydrogenophaga sp. BPS33]
MNLRQIEVFRATMLAGSVTDAARLLHVSQPGISRMLGHIELQLGVRLFERNRGRLQPTPEAHALFAEVEQVYLGVNRIKERASALRAGGGQTLRVLASPSLVLELLPEAIASMVAAFPAARIHIESHLKRDMTRLLARGEADVGFSNLMVDHPPLVSEVVGRWTLSCVMPKGHRFEQAAHVSLAEVLGETLIAFAPDTPQGSFVDSALAEQLQTARSQIEVRSGQVACALVAAGCGIAVVDNLTARAWPSGKLSFRPIRRAPVHKIYRLRNPNFPSSALEDELVARFRREVESSPLRR